MVSQYVSDPANTVFCLCGPGPMLADMRALLQGMNVPDGQIRFEQFETAVAASVLNTAPKAELSDAAAHRVTFSVSGRTASITAAQTLLDAAEAEGVPIPSSCRSGVCQSCRTRVIEGDVDCQSDVLDPEDRSAGFVLPCVSWTSADCVLEA